jgi:hypothetical protein
MREAIMPLLDLGITFPNREDQDGAMMDVANVWKATIMISCIDVVTKRRGSQSIADNIPPIRIAGKYLPNLSLKTPLGT